MSPTHARCSPTSRRHGDREAARADRRTYDVFLKGSYAYIDEMERALSEAAGMEEALLCQMLSVQYENKGDEGAPRPIASALSGRSQQPCLTSREESRRFIC